MAELPELYVIRHGETEWNRAGRWQGVMDSPLTPKGVAQAQALGEFLGRIGVSPSSHTFITSPQGRAQRTADLILNGQGTARSDDRLREIDMGDWTGCLRDEVHIETQVPQNAHVLDIYAHLPNGETFGDLMARVTSFLADLRGPSVLVTHGITSRFLRSAALGYGLDRLRDVPGGQGVVHHLKDGKHRTLTP